MSNILSEELGTKPEKAVPPKNVAEKIKIIKIPLIELELSLLIYVFSWLLHFWNLIPIRLKTNNTGNIKTMPIVYSSV